MNKCCKYLVEEIQTEGKGRTKSLNEELFGSFHCDWNGISKEGLVGKEISKVAGCMCVCVFVC